MGIEIDIQTQAFMLVWVTKTNFHLIDNYKYRFHTLSVVFWSQI